jgi:hypothetical protein
VRKGPRLAAHSDRTMSIWSLVRALHRNYSVYGVHMYGKRTKCPHMLMRSSENSERPLARSTFDSLLFFSPSLAQPRQPPQRTHPCPSKDPPREPIVTCTYLDLLAAQSMEDQAPSTGTRLVWYGTMCRYVRIRNPPYEYSIDTSNMFGTTTLWG